jgi:hypothetical protein
VEVMAMLEKLLSLLNSAMPEAIGGIIATAVLATAGGAWAYLRRRSRQRRLEGPEGDAQKDNYSIQEHRSEVHAGGGFDGSLLSRDSFKIGHGSGSAKLLFGTHTERAEIDGHVEDIDMALPSGGRIIAHARRPIEQPSPDEETGSNADSTS